MSATVTERPTAPPSPAPTARSSRFQRWLSSWRVSLKMARRDALRYKGRSALVLVMVALPVALIVGGLSFASTSMRSIAERLDASVGSGQAIIYSISPEKVIQGIDGQSQWGYNEDDSDASRKAKPIPGFTEDGTTAERTAALDALIPGKVVSVQTGEVRWVNGTKFPRALVMYVDPTANLGPKLTLTSGRWPTTSSEVVVTPLGIHEGMPTSGTLDVRLGTETTPLTIVGTAKVLDPDFGMPHLMSTAPLPAAEGSVWSTNWIITGDPVTWSEVRRLNDYGLALTSRYVVEHPPAASELPGEAWDEQNNFDNEAKLMAAMFGAVLFLVTALLVGPAFAVSAGRQRRSLALAASNGAEVRQLRRSVLGTALVLGVLAAVVGAVVGALAVAAGTAIWFRMRPWSTLFGPLDIPIVPSLIVLICAILAALTAAMIPALRLGRLDIVGVMKGQNVSPPHNRLLPLIGVVLFALGAVGVFVAVTSTSTAAGVAGVFGLVTGAVCLIPLLLVWAGRLAGRFPVAIRMATRDAARQRHRAAPTVAALMAGSALLATFSIALESNTQFEASHYEPRNIAGEGRIGVAPNDLTGTTEQIRSIAPTWRLVPMPYIGAEWQGNTAPSAEPWVSLMTPGCSVQESLPQFDSPDGMVEPTANRCQQVGNQGIYNAGRSQITVMPAAEIVRRFQLDKADGATIAKDGVLVYDAKLIPDGKARLLTGSFRYDERSGKSTLVSEPREIEVAAVPMPANATNRGAASSSLGMVLSTEFTQQHNIPTVINEFQVFDTRGAITRADQKKVQEALGDAGYMEVERGYERPDKWLMLGVLGIAGFLLVVVTLISTALALAEQQADMGTLAAVGATKGTRRRFAAAQAATVAVIGGVLGIAIGLVAGVAIAYPTTTRWWDQSGVEHTVDPTVGIPLIPMAMILLGVPLVAALIAALSIRRAPHVTRRGN
ncbi:MAG: ABC transporter permease [Actinobacteria bacterium]|nr:ABC transporter permease [Actinomycetota bacterium]